jgi:hypothetical protein
MTSPVQIYNSSRSIITPAPPRSQRFSASAPLASTAFGRLVGHEIFLQSN